jgi:hypothetical protein
MVVPALTHLPAMQVNSVEVDLDLLPAIEITRDLRFQLDSSFQVGHRS